MPIFKHCILALSLTIATLSLVAMAKTTQKVIWHPSFYATTPRINIKNPVDLNYCLTHTPNVLSVTIDQISKGAQAENGVFIKYNSYTTQHKHGLGFNIVNGQVWTENQKGVRIWQSPIWLYEQNLSDTGITNTVWATNQCKGKFIGIASIIKD